MKTRDKETSTKSTAMGRHHIEWNNSTNIVHFISNACNPGDIDMTCSKTGNMMHVSLKKSDLLKKHYLAKQNLSMLPQ